MTGLIGKALYDKKKQQHKKRYSITLRRNDTREEFQVSLEVSFTEDVSDIRKKLIEKAKDLINASVRSNGDKGITS